MTNGLGPRLRAARRHARLTQGELAKRASVDKGTVSRIEAGRRGASSRILQQLAQALGVPVGELLGEHDADRGPEAPVTATEAVPALGEVLQLLAMRFGTLPPSAQRRVLRVIQAILE